MKPCEDKWHCKSRSKEERILPIQSKKSEMSSKCVFTWKVRTYLDFL